MNGIRPPYAAPIERLSILFCTVKTGIEPMPRSRVLPGSSPERG